MASNQIPQLSCGADLPEAWRWVAALLQRSCGRAAPATPPSPAPLPPALSGAMLEQLDNQRLLALAPELLAAGEAPQEWQDRVTERRLVNTWLHMQLRQTAKTVSALAEKHGGPQLLFIKGLPVAAHYYKAAYLRFTGDVDIVIESAAAGQWLALLKEAGWKSPYAGRALSLEEERDQKEKHYEARSGPENLDTIAEVHTGLYVSFAGWDWDLLWRAPGECFVPWPELGPWAFRLRPELELLFEPLHSVSDHFRFPLQVVADTIRLIPHVDRSAMLKGARLMRVAGLAAVHADFWGRFSGQDEWREWARECWSQASSTERSLGKFYAKYFWSRLYGRPQPSQLGLGLWRTLRYGLYVPVRCAEIELGMSRHDRGFRRRRLRILVRRWWQILGKGARF